MKKGQLGELIAKAYLVRNGFTIIASNYFSNQGEIDIIALSTQRNVHFIEVKYYRSTNWVSPVAAVNFKKRRKIKETASVFLSKSDVDYREVQFDIISIKNGTVSDYIAYAF